LLVDATAEAIKLFSVMSDPFLNFVSVLRHQVNAGCENFPQGSSVVIVNQTTGEAMSSPVTPASGTAPLGINLPDDFPSGEFYFKGLDKDGGYLAQSVIFPFG
jgi:hypothetical protein